jgi:uncharacterized DUF497 family protein
MTRFEWDPAKAELNRRKHGVSFELAMRVFADPLALSEQDRVEGHELRWTTIGLVAGQLLLVVAHTVRDAEDREVIRIISARKAERSERRRYEQETG